MTGWCTSLVGPWRDIPRAADDGNSSREALDGLLDRLRPEEARTEWPGWIGDRRDEVMLSVGVSAGRPDKKVVVDIPAVARDLAVDIGGGLVRLKYPAWVGNALESDGRLLALRELVRWRVATDGPDAPSVRTLVGWAVGPGRAFCGSWAWRAGLGEVRTPESRAALGWFTGLDVDRVLAHVTAGG